MITTVVTDLDGTLLNRKGKLSEITIETLHALYLRDINIIIATGRLYSDARRTLRDLIFTPAIISCNGAVLNDSDNTDLLVSFYISKTIISQVLKYVATVPLHITLFSNDKWCVLEKNYRHTEYILQSGLDCKTIDFDLIPVLDVNKILINGEFEHISEHYEHLQMLFAGKCNICRTSSTDIEIMPKNINKATALKYYLDYTGQSTASCIAFGDALNDFEMLSSVAEGVVMNNAQNDLMALLPDYPRAAANQDDGVAHYLIDTFSL